MVSHPPDLGIAFVLSKLSFVLPATRNLTCRNSTSGNWLWAAPAWKRERHFRRATDIFYSVVLRGKNGNRST